MHQGDGQRSPSRRLFGVFLRWVHLSLYKVVSVRLMVGWMVGRLYGRMVRNLFFFKVPKWTVF